MSFDVGVYWLVGYIWDLHSSLQRYDKKRDDCGLGEEFVSGGGTGNWSLMMMGDRGEEINR